MKKEQTRLAWPLSVSEIEQVHHTALDILEKIGMGKPPEELKALALEKGCTISNEGRLCFPRTLIEDILSKCIPRTVLPSRGGAPVQLDDGFAHFGHIGVAPSVVDFETGEYRDSTLVDLYDLNRLFDALPGMSTGDVPVSATNISDPGSVGVNTLYAILAATNKHAIVDMADQDQLEPMIQLLEMIIGKDKKGIDSPVTFIYCPTTSPLNYEKKYMSMCLDVVKKGYPVTPLIAPMAGAAAPATLAGALAMTVAEALGVLAAVQMQSPGHPTMLGVWPFVADLHTGGFAGGAAEEPLLSAAAAQMIKWYGIEGTVPSGMTDSKLIDAQSGYEKGISVALAALGGGTFVGEAAGMQGSLMGASFEAFVLDQDMLSYINRLQRGIAVNEETLGFSMIADVVKQGIGNFLYHPLTMKYMRSEYEYPQFADRTMINQWKAKGKPDIRQKAREKTRKLLCEHYPAYIDPDLDARIRKTFNIELNTEDMRPKCGRW
ncbi:trimethylamine methyltransferase family protein [Desulforhopalus singaporensis]|uniref:Trimethylamine---corrinoid protein Co-methyltransferase n=1 Tax=Desulforhopalus singaporensis TaxID=91360 RepID=A0A1H0T5S3_9BACT|nr:trimethylamine methyltransferase family protein [Desulforhopalus singaporensis]SDP49329.1 trimethylamine---corrinoid protein Co-methyltransferase [Desulforhopalus singaporensis]